MQQPLQKNRGNRGGARAPRRDSRFQSFQEVVKENHKLQKFYDSLLGLKDGEAAHEEFWAALRTELPNSFRFCGSKGHALAVKKLLQTRYIPEITKITHLDGEPVRAPEPVPWYPDQLAWWMTTPKNVIRKYPPFAQFQKFLVSEDRVGNISRQEVVSMIPPLLLDVQPGMAVLDLCAAPGSKSAQLLEMVHRGEEGRLRKVLRAFAADDGLEVTKLPEGDEDADLAADPTDEGRATGVLIANDADYKRTQTLIHQLKRLSSPNYIVTNHDATQYPSLRLPSDDPKVGRYLKFDRILADVPCSGDGTIRKNVGLWRDWNPANALGLHAVQCRILVRALQMLKPGGCAVYSTCSMNPVENEAVVRTAVERCGGPDVIEIMDCSKELPELKRRPGLNQWQIIDKSGRIWDRWSDVVAQGAATTGRLDRTMFPRPGDDDSIHLDRCVRVYPHLQDTGGFFIAALRKKVEFKAKPEGWSAEDGEAPPTATKNKENGSEATQNGAESNGIATNETSGSPQETGSTTSTKRPAEDDEGALEPPLKKTKTTDDDGIVTIQMTDELGRKKKPDGPYEEPFKYLPADHPVTADIMKFYGISSRFPTGRYMVRNALCEPAKTIYYTSALVREILSSNEGKGIKFLHAGVRMFMKQDAPSAEVCQWRIQSEGMPILQAYVGSQRILHLSDKETLRKLLIEMFPKLADGAWKELGEVGEAAKDAPMGCYVLRVEPRPGDEFLEPMVMPLWKSVYSLNLMLPKDDRSAMLYRIFNDTTPLVNNHPSSKKQAGDAITGTEEASGERDANGFEHNGGAADAEEEIAKAGEAGESHANGVGEGEANEEMTENDLYAAEDAPSD